MENKPNNIEISTCNLNVDMINHIPKKTWKDQEKDIGYLDYYDIYLTNKPVYICSVDPGIKGGIAILSKNEDSLKIETFKMPIKRNSKLLKTTTHDIHQTTSRRKFFVDPLAAFKLIKNYVNIEKGEKFYFGIIEQVHAFPKQGLVSTFNFGKETGMIESLLWITSHYMYHVHIKSWKQRFGLKGKKLDRINFLSLLNDRVNYIVNYFNKQPGANKLKIYTNPKRDGELEAILLLFYSLEKLSLWQKIYNIPLPKFD